MMQRLRRTPRTKFCHEVVASLILVFGCVGVAGAADDPFEAAVRPTEPKTPDGEKASFRVPEGFKIELFASEPMIQKPINMAFDARGRLWVAGSTEYPFAAPDDRKGKDSIRILEDTDHDGKADKMTVFADGLNIPIGIYPYKDGAIAFSIPSIYDFQDTDGDGKADKREMLYGPFAFDRDTHGLNNAFRRGFDGWLYANHGWANTSSVAGRDGNRVELITGNSYRMRLDGARIEHFTWGQVNPFGMTFDPSGDLFNADCHTRPIMLLLRNGNYDSFGRPHNGLGYVPGVMEHTHGSTAIAGTTQYTGLNFPAEYHGNMFVGNVMTSRVNRDSLRYHGSTVKAVAEPDFVSSDDPWFRPVDLQIGPDGALYVADFYNKIIGHYEVPLTHPGRDRDRGRIWRVVYVGDEKKPAPLSETPDLRAADTAALIAAFSHPVLGVRQRATDELVDRIGKASVEPLRGVLGHETNTVRAHALWTLYRLGAVQPAELVKAASDPDRLVRGHVMRVLSETPKIDEELRSLILKGLHDEEPLVRRAAVDALGRHPRVQDIDSLVALSKETPEADAHLRHMIKLSLLEIVKVPGYLTEWSRAEHPNADNELMAAVALALPTQEAGRFLIAELRRQPVPAATMSLWLAHAAKHLPPDTDVVVLADIARRGVADDLDLQLDLLQAIRNGLRQQGRPEPQELKDWAATLAGRLIASIGSGNDDWVAIGKGGQSSPRWQVEPRQSEDGASETPFLSSLSLGETYVGTLKSRTFRLPAKLSLYLCGHLGYPDRPVEPRNLVRVRLAATGEELGSALAPRSDIAKKVVWDLTAHAGQEAYLEVVDDVAVEAFAWVAIARVEPEVVALPVVTSEVATRRRVAAAQLAETLNLRDLEGPLRGIALSELADPPARRAAAHAVVAFHPDATRNALVECVGDPALAPDLGQLIAQEAVRADGIVSDEVLARVFKSVPTRLQTALAGALAQSRDGGNRLLALVEAGTVSGRVLQHPGLRDKLLAAQPEGAAERVDKLTAALPPIHDETQKLIDARRARFDRAKASVEKGREVFTKNCAGCHQVAGKGALVGPQLDGVGKRGIERVIEDVLDPNRNVDPAFMSTLYALTDGRVVSGLFRRKEGQNLIVADQTGKELVIAAGDVDEQRNTRLSPMPADFGAVIPEGEFLDLMSFLLDGTGEPAAK